MRSIFSTPAIAAMGLSLGLILPSSILSIEADATPPSEDTTVDLAAEARALADCPTGYLCIWSGSLYSGSLWKTALTSPQNLPSGFGSGSVVNNRASYSYVYSGSKGTGSYRCVAPGARVNQMLGVASAAVSFNSTC